MIEALLRRKPIVLLTCAFLACAGGAFTVRAEPVTITLPSDNVTLKPGPDEQMVQAQYDVLDNASSQGLSDIPSRTGFFKQLYTVEGLDGCNYAMDDSMREYVREKLSNSASLREVEGHYLFLTP